MNNYWETNFKADQSGEVTLRYSVYPHREFDPVQVEKRGIEQCRPLIPVESSRFAPVFKPDFKFSSNTTIIASMKPVNEKDILLRLYNPSAENDTVSFEWQGKPKKIYLCDPFGNNIKAIEDIIEIPAMGILHILFK